MQIKYVVSTMVFWWREHPLSFEQECQFLNSLGFGIEIWPNIRGQDECRYERRNWPRLAAATEGMIVAMNARKDQPTLAQWTEQIECAKILNAHIIVELESLGLERGCDLNGSEFAAEVIKIADDNDVQLCIETGPLPILEQLGERFDSLKYCLDTGFANIDPEHNFKEYVDQLAPRIVHLHLTDNYGQIDDHEPPGLNGGIQKDNWNYLLETLNKYDNEIIGSFEMCPCMPSVMIRQASEFLFDVLKWPNRPQILPGQSDLMYYPM